MTVVRAQKSTKLTGLRSLDESGRATYLIEALQTAPPSLRTVFRDMFVRAFSIAAIAASSVSAFAPAGAPLGLAGRAAPAISSARAPAVSPLALRMADEPAKEPVGKRAEAFSAGFAHPAPVAVDADIREILPHRCSLLHFAQFLRIRTTTEDVLIARSHGSKG